ncbi:hypothetical protein NECAME_06396 [Necator americanus]|uniref:Uncharacterized protein n=1 Tax=Necator americanus TaxID=51031 RepID=W2TUG0_NECAM|nr:hypothetical protein NECAME_06396 [Necator americanus]ETN85443.1 hypothetical protein NECAME_06396 [Necator americanus]
MEIHPLPVLSERGFDFALFCPTALTDLKTVLLSRIPCILMQGQQGHQILISSLTVSGQERTNAFGRMGFVHGPYRKLRLLLLRSLMLERKRRR